ncbi:hypothetical protein ACFVXH_39645 [Kitasatospora sp. NPDC058184]|uniref:hypothetical protein n=1 Tax=Kitasatospora sp. NPDC058184 TaxID=3346370 RepID=UPI0036DAC595
MARTRPGAPARPARPARPTRPGRPRRFGARHYTCTPCEVTWSGPEADCWTCGRPATREHPTPTSALQQLLAPTTGADTRPGHDHYRAHHPQDQR